LQCIVNQFFEFLDRDIISLWFVYGITI
jgi:hypothetical protein